MSAVAAVPTLFRRTLATLVSALPCLAAAGVALLAPAALPGAARAALPTDFADQLVVGSLAQPTSFAFLPDGRMLIIEQKTFRVRLVVNGLADTTLVVPEVNGSGNERGLLGITVDPQWPTRPYVYLMFDRTPGLVNYIVRYKATGELTNAASSDLTLSRRLVLIADIPDNASNHNGGTLRFGPDGMLYASLGEDADPCGAQDYTQLKGCILRLKVDALPDTFGFTVSKLDLVPPDNPYAADPNFNKKLTFAKGLRNPFSFNIDPADGHLYIADVGQNIYEELDECVGGENFGWPQYEGNVAYSGYPGTCPAVSPTFPIGVYNRTGFANASIMSATLYRPIAGGAYSFPMSYNGDYFYGEYYQGWLRHLRRDINGVWQAAPGVPGQPNATDWATATANCSNFLVGPDGGLYYCKQFSAPSIRRIVYTGANSGVIDGGPGGRAALLQVFPNPLPGRGARMRLQFRMESPGAATLALFDVAGRHVKTLREGQLDAGPAEAYWDATDASGRTVAPGVYFARLVAGAIRSTARVVVTGH